ncbi:MAG: peptidoglycan/LPS O-acetylase OafA/YrhL [Candidatus Deianiraeaceae bacterium]|jgi:peptidoglycan/LPS O-acetylase OafA/YrhL
MDISISSSASKALHNIRGIAAFYVMLGHVAIIANYMPIVGKFFPDPVTLFFFISGMLIPLSLQKSNTMKSFVFHRIFRLFPVLIAITLLHLLFVKDGLLTALFTATITFDIFGRVPQTSVYWTLAIEIHMYILYCIVYKFRPKIDALFPYIIVGILLALYTMAVIFGQKMAISILSRNLSCITLIVIGSAMLLKNKVHVVVLSLMFCVFVMCCTQNGFGLANLEDKYMLIDVKDYGMMYKLMLLKIITGLVGFVVLMKALQFKSKVLTFLGNISYPLYLLHVTVMDKIGIDKLHKQVTVVALSCIIAYLIHKYIERPFVRKGKTFVAGKVDTVKQWW